MPIRSCDGAFCCHDRQFLCRRRSASTCSERMGRRLIRCRIESLLLHDTVIVEASRLACRTNVAHIHSQWSWHSVDLVNARVACRENGRCNQRPPASPMSELPLVDVLWSRPGGPRSTRFRGAMSQCQRVVFHRGPRIRVSWCYIRRWDQQDHVVTNANRIFKATPSSPARWHLNCRRRIYRGRRRALIPICPTRQPTTGKPCQ